MPLDTREPTDVDLVKHNDTFDVTFKLPSFEKDDDEIRVPDCTLHVKADHDETETYDEGS